MQPQSQTLFYCEHFEYLKAPNSIYIEDSCSCKYCLYPKANLYLCLAAGCKTYVCGRNNKEHLTSHLEGKFGQSRFPTSKKIPQYFHKCGDSLNLLYPLPHINPRFRHVVWGLRRIENIYHVSKQDPFRLRLFVQPFLKELSHNQIAGWIENSQGHRKSSRNLTGLFGDKYNHTINSALQLLAHCKFIQELILNIKSNNKIIDRVAKLFLELDEAKDRVANSNAISELFYKIKPELRGYARKDPFQQIMLIIGLLNQELGFNIISPDQQALGYDDWDIYYRAKEQSLHQNQNAIKHSPLSAAMSSTLSMNYECSKCGTDSSVQHAIQFMKLGFGTKRRKVKEVEKELAEVKVESPAKRRRNSLLSLFSSQEECPILVQELIIDFLKSKIHKDKICDQCIQPLLKKKIHFVSIPNILLIQIARMPREGYLIDKTQVELSTAPLDMGPFTSNPKQQIIYDFQAAICLQKGGLFPVVVVSQTNKQTYRILNQQVEFLKMKMNAYVLIYQKRASQTAIQKYNSLQDVLADPKTLKTYVLPDFWKIQLRNGIQLPLFNPLVCKHNQLKVIQSKMMHTEPVSRAVYEDLVHFYSGVLYESKKCEDCLQDISDIEARKEAERAIVAAYDKPGSFTLAYCMISKEWIIKWSNFLYSKKAPNGYLHKGHPLPPPIQNNLLLTGGKCRPNLVKNVDYKVVNLVLWRFLKQLYGGGPQIRYKWSEEKQKNFSYEDIISQCSNAAGQVKAIFGAAATVDCPKRVSSSFIERSSLWSATNQDTVQQPFQVGMLEE